MAGHHGCSGFRMAMRCSRLEIRSLGMAAGFGLSLADLLRARDAAAKATPRPPAESLILTYLHGGHPQHETWDPKPLAPAEVRGELGTIPTVLSSVMFGEVMPRSAAIASGHACNWSR